jgi:PqqD family protein of HPr-rel-A system
VTVPRKPSRSGAVLWLRVDDATPLYDTRAGVVHVLNDTAASLWALCDGTRTAAGVVADLHRRFEVSRQVLATAVRSTLIEFRARRLIE